MPLEALLAVANDLLLRGDSLVETIEKGLEVLQLRRAGDARTRRVSRIVVPVGRQLAEAVDLFIEALLRRTRGLGIAPLLGRRELDDLLEFAGSLSQRPTLPAPRVARARC